MSVIASSLIGKVAIEGATQAKSELESVGKKAGETESSFKKMKEQIARGFEFGTGMQLAQIPGSIFDAAKEQVVDIIKLAMDHQQVMSQTNQVLRSTHDVSKMTADSLDELAQKFGKTTQFSADTVQSGENLLLTFTNIGKGVFPQATQAILDVSQAMGQDLKESAIQVGKALGDPTTGMTALQRIGVTFSESEKEQIKTMMKHNDIMGAQKVILKELNTEFGGSAQAAGKTFAGALKIAQDRVEEIKIKIGTALLPILNEFLQYFEQHMLPRLNDFSTWFQQYGIPRLQEFGDWFQHDGIPLLNQFGQWFNDNGIPVLQQFGGTVGQVAGYLVDFVKWMHEGSPPAQALLTVLGAIAVLKTAQAIGDTAKSILDFGKNTAEFLANDGKKLLDFFGPNGLANDVTNTGNAISTMGNDASVAGGEVTTLGTESATTGTEMATMGTDAEGASVALAGAGGTGGLVAAIGDVTGAVMGLLGPIGGLLLAFSTVPSTVDSMNQQGMLPDWLKQLIYGKNPYATAPHTNGSEVDPILLHSQPNPILTRGKNNHFASGTSFAPGGWSLVGEYGPEWANIPRGTSILPTGTPPPTGNQGGNQPLILSIDGVLFARAMMPYITDSLRYGVGSVGY